MFGMIVDMTSPRPIRDRGESRSAAQTDAVLRATRALVGVAAASMAGIDDTVTLPQFRVLVMLFTRGPLNLGAVAKELNVNPSNASRTCDRLMKVDLIDRKESDVDRRVVMLMLTPAGRRLVGKVTRRRRTAIERILASLTAADREAVARALAMFADAAGEPPDDAGVLSLL